MTVSNTTDTNQASELYELCKEVYERTGGKPKNGETKWLLQNEFSEWSIIDLPAIHNPSYPLYTSDYLLEKLPAEIGKKILVVITGDRPHAGYAERDNYGNYTLDEHYWKNAQYSNEVRKALLKLTIALSEAGELNG